MTFKENQKGNILLFYLLALFLLFSPLWSEPRKPEDDLTGTSGKKRLDILVDLVTLYNANAPQKAVTFGKEALSLLKTMGRKETEARVLSNLCFAYRVLGDMATAREYGEKARQMAETFGFKLRLADVLNNLGLVQANLGNYQQAIKYYRQSQKIFEELNKKGAAAHVQINIGSVYLHLGDFHQALKYFLDSLATAEKIKDKGIMAGACLSMGVMHNDNGDRDQAMAYFQKAIKNYREIGSFYGTAAVYANIAIIHYKKKEHKESLRNHLIALELHKKTGNKRSAAISMNNIGLAYFFLKKPAQALDYFSRALAIRREIKDKRGIAETLDSIGWFYIRQKKYREALDPLKQALTTAETLHAKSLVKSVRKNLAFAYAGLKDYPAAITNYQKYTAIDKRIDNEKNRKKINDMETRYKLAAKENHLKILKKNHHIQELKISQFKILRNSFIAAFVFILAFLIVIYSRYRLKRKMNRLLENKNTQLEASNIKLKESETHLQELNQTKDKFFSIIAHDLKSPLHSVTRTAEFLIRSIPRLGPEKVSHFIANLNASANHLVTLLENLLQWARSQTGRIAFSPERIDLSDLVENACHLLEENAAHKHIKLHCQAEPETGAFADRNMVLLILGNLITNAVKFTKEGGEIIVSAGYRDQRVEISVADTGIGMTREDLRQLFRLDGSLSRPGTRGETGTGLGLIICKELVEKNRGKIWTESHVNKGSTFYFTLPRENEK